MPKQLVIFGNGLGRSIDNDFYSLERVLQESWNDQDVLDDAQKELICSCLDNGVIENELQAPTNEAQLANLQKVLNACDIIAQFENDAEGGGRWLNEHGQRFPQAIRQYLHDSASRFHDPEMTLPRDFAVNLRQFVVGERPHIATLNYDDLLYECFTNTPVFGQHMLRDGFFGGQFRFDQHRYRMNVNEEGWFLHLHGSPLFVDRNRIPNKITRANLRNVQGNNSTHLVLTNASSKASVISGSKVLRTYWQELERILDSEVIVTLFGYGGGDTHLNELIGMSGPNVRVRVVCRNAEDEDPAERWRRTLTPKNAELVDVVPVDDLLQFNEWLRF